MNRSLPLPVWALALAFSFTMVCGGWADSAQEANDAKSGVERESAGAQRSADSAGAKEAKETTETKETTTTASKSKYPAFAELLKDAEPIEGLIKLYRKDGKLYGEISSGQLNKDFIVVISIARGIGERPLLGGMSWSLGDDWIWQFRKVDESIQIVRRNVRFQAAQGTPQQRAVHLAYTDSVLFSLPVATVSPDGADVVDLTPVFMSDLPQISQVLEGFSFSKEKSSWASVKGFKDNIEIQVAATYSSSGTKELETVADTRGVTLYVHYSISPLKQTGYQPRMADDRVGYFLTVVKDYSKSSAYDRFVRYINRWDLRKADPSAEVSPPKTPIIFWLEKTIPYKYRSPIREGILEWNKAFRQAGFADAIEVRQQPDDAEWDPEDIKYNTFRWITASAGFAMGPSRVNPTTGQILDADILFDADFLPHWKQTHEVLTAEGEAALTGGSSDLCDYPQQLSRIPPPLRHRHWLRCDCARGMSQQLAFGWVMLAEDGKPASKELIEKLIAQGLKEVVMHEVGHTLGLRHNFKASTYLTLEELNDVAQARKTGLAASLMDYLPMNLVPKGEKHSTYFSTTLGPYDYWAIEYGYKPISGHEEAELKKIASRSAEPALHYGTDEDARGIDPDPLVNRFDLGKDPIAFARQRVRLINQAWPDLVDRVTDEGDGYQRARRAFDLLLLEHGRAMHFAARFIGGVYVHRDHKGQPGARPPYVIVDRKKQDEAMKLLEQEVFGQQSYQFPPKLYNYLAHSNWYHWGTTIPTRVDYPVHETILRWQDRVLAELLSSATLSRLVDSELKVPADQEAFTAAELIERLTGAIFSELEDLKGGEPTDRKPAINSLRRSLQSSYLKRLADVAMGNTSAPGDCRSIAYAELETLEARIKQVLAGKAQLDPYTRAHLSDSAARIRKVLEARPQLRNP
jgi:hypothetical protein